MIQHLSTTAIGAPIIRLGVSFFPVYLPSNDPPEIKTGTSSGIVVRELENAEVEALLAVNPTDTPIRETYRRDKARAAAARELSALGPLPGQCGIAVSQGRWITALEVFGARHLLEAHWGALIKSHLMSILSIPAHRRPILHCG